MVGEELSQMRKSRELADLAERSYWREDDARRIVDAWRESGEPVVSNNSIGASEVPVWSRVASLVRSQLW